MLLEEQALWERVEHGQVGEVFSMVPCSQKSEQAWQLCAFVRRRTILQTIAWTRHKW